MPLGKSASMQSGSRHSMPDDESRGAVTSPATFPFHATALTLSGPAGALEAAVDIPSAAEARAGVATVCHPQPQHGGSMHNKVVTMLERSLRESGLATVVFNFRGVGASQGTYDDGRGETEDLLAVAAWTQRM